MWGGGAEGARSPKCKSWSTWLGQIPKFFQKLDFEGSPNANQEIQSNLILAAMQCYSVQSCPRTPWDIQVHCGPAVLQITHISDIGIQDKTQARSGHLKQIIKDFSRKLYFAPITEPP